jgi:hypothetical protein
MNRPAPGTDAAHRTRPRSVHEPRGWRGDEATSNLEGISAQRVKYEDQSNLQWPPMTLPANTGGRRHSAYWRPNCSARCSVKWNRRKQALRRAKTIAANADSYRQIGPRSPGLARITITRNIEGDEQR